MPFQPSPVLIVAALLPAALHASPGGDDTAGHPHVRTVMEYHDARERGDLEALRSILAEDSRIWFGEKQGPGRRRDAAGGGPWSDWDEFFNSESRIAAVDVEGGTVRTTVEEINDWFRLVDRPASLYYITYWFDAGGRIEGTLIHSIPGREEPVDRLAEFEAWARERHPGLMERLMPDGRIDPALDNARAWKQRLLEWRREVGLDDPLAAR